MIGTFFLSKYGTITKVKKEQTMVSKGTTQNWINFLGTHPNIWLYINKIKAEESTATLKYIRLNNDTLSYRNRNILDVDRDLQFQNAKIRYLTDKIDIMEYLDEVSNCVCNYDEVKITLFKKLNL
jgi:hypothetical protein